MGGTGSPKEPVFLSRERWRSLVPFVLFIPAVLFLVYRWNPTVSHHLAETFSIIVACSVFMLTWNARNFIDNQYFVFLGISYLFVGAIDYLHLLLLSGAFAPGSPAHPIALWYSARFVQSVALMFAPFFVSRRLRPWLVFLGFAALSTLLVTLTWAGALHIFYIPGVGSTSTEILWDYIIVGTQFLSVGALWRVRKHFDGEVFQRLVVSVFFSIAAEVADDLNTDKYIYGSLIGHYLNVVSYYLVYKALVATGLIRPYDLLFRNLKRSEEELRVAQEDLERRVAGRTLELQAANERLGKELADRQRAVEMRQLILDLQRVIGDKNSVRDFLSSVSTFLQERFGFKAVGIRYHRDADYPYFEARGFPEEFVEAEMSLCTPAPGRDGRKNGDRRTIYDCACGAVIDGKCDPSLPFFTPNGTFWTNCASDLLVTDEAARAIVTRGRCVRQGYESIALVPLRIGDATFGLLQCNDRRKEVFQPDLLAQLERVAENVAASLSRLLSREALQESEDRFRTLVENEPVGAMIVLRDRVVFRNPEQERLLGPIPVGFDVRQLGPPHPEDVPKVERFYDAVREGEAFRQGMELRFSVPGVETRQAAYRWVQCRSVPIDFRGETAALVNMVDITRVKELEQIAGAREKLASLGQLAAGIAHEIRNPLSGININISTLDLLCRRAEGLDPEEKEKIRAVVAQVYAASGKISAVVKRVLDFSKPIPPRMDRIDVVGVVRESLALSAASIRNGGVRLRQDLPPEPLYCRADVTLLGQVVINLITNALQAMETVDREKFLTVGVAREGERVEIRIADTGPGVTGDLLGKIFDPFYTTRKDGHGIGLSFSQRVVSEHHGRLTAGAAEGGGAMFRIDLPLWRERRPE